MDDLWAVDALQALHLSLVRSKADLAQLSDEQASAFADFSPAFVYPIFGDEETIFGYRNLRIQLSFASGSLKQYLHITYDAKFPSTPAVQADDPEAKLFEFIPPSYTKLLPDFDKTVAEDAKSFVPFGERVGAYRMRDKGKGKGKAGAGKVPERRWETVDPDEEQDGSEARFEVFATNWDTKGFTEFHRRMQIFVLLYIEGATYIEEDDPRWEFLTLFERRKTSPTSYSYHFVGFTSFYSFFCWPDTKRLRLSQFVILPPYQAQGHGSALYNVAYQRILTRPEISELTVEDPAEAFEDMRDKADLHTLLVAGALDGLSAPVDREVSEAIRKKYKLADRQFYRLIEMILLLGLDSSSPTPAQAKAFRLSVKNRLYLFNREMLAQIEPQERKEKLQETYEGVERDYRRITAGFKV